MVILPGPPGFQLLVEKWHLPHGVSLVVIPETGLCGLTCTEGSPSGWDSTGLTLALFSIYLCPSVRLFLAVVLGCISGLAQLHPGVFSKCLKQVDLFVVPFLFFCLVEVKLGADVSGVGVGAAPTPITLITLDNHFFTPT